MFFLAGVDIFKLQEHLRKRYPFASFKTKYYNVTEISLPGFVVFILLTPNVL
jgi:hypothetical protein